MIVTETSLPGVLLVELEAFADFRGVFVETYREQYYAETGISARFVQDSYSRSLRRVLRGLHFQVREPQAKLVYVPRGRVFDVAVDLRKGSPTFGKWFGTELSEDNHRQLFIPGGFAHGFCSLSETADVYYKFSDYYRRSDERGIIWNDPDIGIVWPLEKPRLSDKDRRLGTLASIPEEQLPVASAE